MSPPRAAPLLADKPCGEAVCPLEMRELWAKAHLAVMRWDEFMEHPTDPQLRSKCAERMEDLRAAARIAEPVMEVRLKHLSSVPVVAQRQTA